MVASNGKIVWAIGFFMAASWQAMLLDPHGKFVRRRMTAARSALFEMTFTFGGYDGSGGNERADVGMA